MTQIPATPPLKCQGIKTKLVPAIKHLISNQSFDRWVEPFCGSCVVALNVRPRKALLCDSNPHIIRFYQDVQNRTITPSNMKVYLEKEGSHLSKYGEPYFYEVRERFNNKPDSFDFLFLNRSCFNGIMRFNKKGKFNVPYCHKPERFAPAYVTKIVNQIHRIAQLLCTVNWTFQIADFRETLAQIKKGDFIYADPPYAGRHTDYFNNWSDEDESLLASTLGNARCDFILSTWHSNQFRTNGAIQDIWGRSSFHVQKHEHFYHVGSSENLRHPMTEAFITNFSLPAQKPVPYRQEQSSLFAN